MANDLLGGLGSLGGLGDILGGIAKNVIPKDTPEGKLLNAQSNLSSLQKQESELLLEIGRQAYGQNPSIWPQDSKLKLVQQNIAAAKTTLTDAQAAQKEAEAVKAAEDAKCLCPECGHKNPDGVKFCQECGSSLDANPRHCGSCGAELTPGTRFCGGCGARQGEA
ncbi:MAG: zinc ribbon domain-containing protein [Propionibacteriaceae bacterium]|jgi:hypothetical protein|nr:zinc ribbon domain-containing protein [Propionibacteriaceae bacterium]